MDDIVVDAHVHLLPGRLAAKVRAHFSAIGDALAYPIDHEVICDRLAADGVDAVWTLPYAHKPGVASWLNESTSDIAARSAAVAIVGGCTVHPGDDDPAAIVRTAVEDHGLRVLKLHSSVGSFDADDRRLDAVWAYVSEVALPVVIHVGHGTNGRTNAAELVPIETTATRFPAAHIIIAHCAHPDTDEALELVERHANVYADLTPVMWEPPALAAARVAAVHDKLLFGSDAPNTTITVGTHLDTVRSMAHDPTHAAAMLGNTARRLIADVRT